MGLVFMLVISAMLLAWLSIRRFALDENEQRRLRQRIIERDHAMNPHNGAAP